MKKKISLLFFLLLSIVLMAEERVGGYLQEKLNVRAAGMGDAMIGTSSEEGFVYNPAGLAFSKESSINFSTGGGYNKITGIEAVIPLVEEGGIGVGINYTKLSIDEIDQRDNEGNKIGTLSDEENLLAFGLGFQYEKNLGLGVTLKKMEQKLGEKKADGYTVDAGILWKIKDVLYLGTVFTNIKSDGLKWDTRVGETDELPKTVKMGGSLRLFENKFNSSIVYENELSERGRTALKIGEEVWIKNRIALRIGRKIEKNDKIDNFEDQDYLTFGTGLKIKVFTLDYSFSNEDLGKVNRVSFGMKF